MSDAYNYIPSFFSDNPKSGALTYDQILARRKIAAALATRQRGFPKNIGEGLTSLGDAIGDVLSERKLAAAEARYKGESDATVQRLIGPEATQTPVAPSAQPVPDAGPGPMSPDVDPFGGAPKAQAPQTPPAVGQAMATKQPLTASQASQQPSMSIDEWMGRVARNESGGRKDAYTLVGERSRRGDYPYGKYQVMGENVGPWTQAYLGQKMTPEEFLANPDAQDQVARARGSEYMTKYGPDGAARAWFAGERGMNDPKRKDTLGTHVAEYSRRFNIPMVSRDQVVASAARQRPAAPSAPAFAPEEPGVQMASLDGGAMPPGATPTSGPPRQDIVNALAQPQAQQSPMQPQPAPQPMQAQRIAQQMPIGTPVPSRVTPPAAGPPPAPAQTPVTPREAEIRRAIGASTDPRVAGQLQAVADQLEAGRKFKDAQNMELWKKDVAAYEKRTDPLQQEQLQKAQTERATAERERIKTEQRGGVSQGVIDKQLEENGKAVRPLREASVAINQVEDLLNKGMFTGLSGKAELLWAKAKMAAGGAVDPRVQATEQFTAAIKPVVAAARAALAGGANISDRDMQAAEAAAGGDITLTEEGIRGIMKSLRVVQLQTARHHQKLLATAAGGDPTAERTLNGLYGLPMENIIPKDDPTVQRLLQNADNEHERGLFNSAYNTPGLAERIITRNRAPQ